MLAVDIIRTLRTTLRADAVRPFLHDRRSAPLDVSQGQRRPYHGITGLLGKILLVAEEFPVNSIIAKRSKSFNSSAPAIIHSRDCAGLCICTRKREKHCVQSFNADVKSNLSQLIHAGQFVGGFSG